MALTLKLIEGWETRGFERSTGSANTAPTIDTANTRGGEGTACMRMPVTQYGHWVYDPYQFEGTGNTNAKMVSFWLKGNLTGSIYIWDAYNSSSQLKCSLRLTSTGRIYPYNASRTFIGTVASATPFTDGNWHLVEFWYEESASASWAIYLDGVLDTSGSGANFRADATDTMWVGVNTTSVVSQAAYMDDLCWGECGSTADLLSQQNYNGLDIFAAAGGASATTYNNGFAPTGSWQNIQEIPVSDTNTCTYSEAASGQTERQPPDTIAVQTNLTGSVTDIDDDPDSPDANWLTASGSSTLRTTFPTPSGPPDTGAGVQNFRVLMRKNATGPAAGTSAEDIVPDGLGGQDANLTGDATTIDEDPAGTWPGNDWRTASSDNSNSVCHATFGTPTGNPTTGAGVQSFWIHARLTTNGTACTYNVYLYENGTVLNGGTAIATGSLTSTTGQTIEATWNASLLGTADGSLVECVFEVVKSGGSPANRTSGEVDAVYWECTYDTGGSETQPGYEIKLYENGSEVVAAGSATGTLTDAGGDTVVQFSWDATNLGTADGSLVECYVNQTSGADRYIEIGAVEWNVTYTEAEVTKYGYIQADTGTYAGPSGRSLDGDILAGSTVYARARYTGSGSTLVGSIYYGTSQSAAGTADNFSLTLTASLANYFKLITNTTYIPTSAYYGRSGFGKASTTDVSINASEVLYMMAYAPSLGIPPLEAAAGSYTLTGSAADLTASRELDAAAGSYALTGSAADLKLGFVLQLEAGSYSLTGAAAAFANGYVIQADAGSYTYTGEDAVLTSTGAFAVDAGSYSITGADAAFSVSGGFAADAGSYTQTGSAADLLAQRYLGTLSTRESISRFSGAIDPKPTNWTNLPNAVDGSTATYSFTTTEGSASDAFMLMNNLLVADGFDTQVLTKVEYRVYCQVTGSGTPRLGINLYYTKDAETTNVELLNSDTFDQQSAGWTSWTELAVPTGGWGNEYDLIDNLYAYAWGQDATGTMTEARIYKTEIRHTFTLSAYAVVGAQARLAAHLRMPADAGAYAYTGAATDYLLDHVLGSDAGAYSLSGAAVDLLRDVVVTADAGAYTYTGIDALLLRAGDRVMFADAGSYSVTGSAADLTATIVYDISADSGSYAVTGGDAAMLRALRMAADSGSYSATGADADLSLGFLLDADSGVYSMTGANVQFNVAGSSTRRIIVIG